MCMFQDRQVSWLTDKRLGGLPNLSVAYSLRLSVYSDEFAQAFNLFPYYPQGLTAAPVYIYIP